MTIPVMEMKSSDYSIKLHKEGRQSYLIQYIHLFNYLFFANIHNNSNNKLAAVRAVLPLGS